MAADTRLIEVSHLSRRFGEFEAVRDVSFSVDRGEILGLLGPNGAGKSTSMKMIAGTLVPSGGSVELAGIDLLTEPRQAKRNLGFSPEQPPVYRDQSVDEYLTFAARLRGLSRQDTRLAVPRAKQRCGLESSGDRIIGNLSKGYVQRVGIAQAIVHDPAIVLLDEPTSGLDPNQRIEIRELIGELRSDRCVVLSSHVLAEVQSVCSRVVILRAGEVVHDRQLDALGDAIVTCHRIATREVLPPERLAACPGVSDAQTITDKLVRVRHDGTPATIDSIIECARDSGLVEFVAERGSLEELFISLTMGNVPRSPLPGESEQAPS
jgi:ABC-2 type transport system ATP-binding protein